MFFKVVSSYPLCLVVEFKGKENNFGNSLYHTINCNKHKMTWLMPNHFMFTTYLSL